MRNGARLDLSWPDSDADLAVAALPACQLAGRAAATCCCFGSSTQKRLQRTHIGQSSQDGNQPSYRESTVQSEDWAEDSCYLASKRTPLLPPQSHWSSGGPLSPVRNTRVSLATFDSSSCASNFPAAVSSSLPPKHKPDSDGAQASQVQERGTAEGLAHISESPSGPIPLLPSNSFPCTTGTCMCDHATYTTNFSLCCVAFWMKFAPNSA